MLLSTQIFTSASILIYFVLTLWLTAKLTKGVLPHKAAITLFAAIALLLHLITLTLDLQGQDSGQNLSILNIASLSAWVITLMMTLIYLRKPVQVLLPFTYGFSAVLLLIDLFSNDSYLTHIETHPSVLVHITLSLLAYSILNIAALMAILLSVINGQLKSKKKFALSPVLPPLMTVERQIFNLILMGTLLLAASLITGFFFLDNFLGSGKAHKAIMSFIALIIYIVVLWRHYTTGVRGRWLIISTVSGAAMLTLGYFGSRFIREVILG